MGHYPFTLFNGITLLVLLLTFLLVWRRLRGTRAANWPLIYYAAVVGYTLGFSGGLNPYWVLAAVVFGLFVRCLPPSRLRFLEFIPLIYIAWRLVRLLLMW